MESTQGCDTHSQTWEWIVIYGHENEENKETIDEWPAKINQQM